MCAISSGAYGRNGPVREAPALQNYKNAKNAKMHHIAKMQYDGVAT